MKSALAIAAVAEAATGIALFFLPSLVGRLLLGEGLTGAAVPVARVTGIALIALGLACWPGSRTERIAGPGLLGMLCYGLLATLYLGYLGLASEWVGPLLWPAVAVHAVLSILLAREWLNKASR
jgi:hypothetical protein